MSSPDVFQVPHFTFWTMLYTGLGATLFWSRTSRNKLKVYVLSSMLDAFEVPEGGLRQTIEFIIFLGFGILIGIGIASPTTVAQAVTAGFAWTGFVAKKG
jgi:hypothetical protein